MVSIKIDLWDIHILAIFEIFYCKLDIHQFIYHPTTREILCLSVLFYISCPGTALQLFSYMEDDQWNYVRYLISYQFKHQHSTCFNLINRIKYHV